MIFHMTYMLGLFQVPVGVFLAVFNYWIEFRVEMNNPRPL